MKELIIETITPSMTNLKIFCLMLVLFFMTLENNPIDAAISGSAQVDISGYNHIFAPFYEFEMTSFGAEYCGNAAGFLKCVAIEPAANLMNFAYWYGVSIIGVGICAIAHGDGQ